MISYVFLIGLQSRVRRFDSDPSLHQIASAQRHNARVAEQVDARDLKSLGGNPVPVRLRPRAPMPSISCDNACAWILARANRVCTKASGASLRWDRTVQRYIGDLRVYPATLWYPAAGRRGIDGLRHSFAQKRVDELICSGMTWSMALERTSQLMRHYRPEEVLTYLLAQHFLRTYREAIGNDIRSIAPETIALLVEHDWPGNVRELANVVEHAVIVEKGPAILPSSLPMNLIESRDGTETPETSSDLGLREKLNLLEKEILLDTLLRANGIKKQAAAMLGIDPRNMPYLLRKHQLRDGLRSN